MTFDLSIETQPERNRKAKAVPGLDWKSFPSGGLWAQTDGGIYQITKDYMHDGARRWTLQRINASGETIWKRIFVWKMEAKKAAAEDSAAWIRVRDRQQGKLANGS